MYIPDDEEVVDTLGFRGEALNAIARLSNMRITSRHQDDEIGWSRCFTTGSSSFTAKERGTTIIISDLFHSLPVRKLDFEKTYKAQYNKTFNLITEYAIIHPEIEFKVWNHEPPVRWFFKWNRKWNPKSSTPVELPIRGYSAFSVKRCMIPSSLYN